MRYYDILVTDPSSGATVKRWTSLVNGRTDPNALNVELDIFAYNWAQPAGGSYLRVWGVSLQDISQGQNLVGKNITVFAGMQRGLPLANPAQAGIIAQGQVYQAFGNWDGLNESIDLLLLPYVGTVDRPANIVVTWRAGQQLASVIRSTLGTAFPNLNVSVNISPKLVLSYDEVGYYGTLAELAAWVKARTAAIVGGGYGGVEMTVQQNNIRVYDGTTQTSPRQIAFTDLIGQPTWIDFPDVQIKTVMRADTSVGDYVNLPSTLVTATPGSQIGTPFRDRPSFQGAFLVTLVRHVGNFRQADGNSWVTVLDATPVQLAA